MTEASIPNKNDTDSEIPVDKNTYTVSTESNKLNESLKEAQSNSNNTVENTKLIEESKLEIKVEMPGSNGSIPKDIQLVNLNCSEANENCITNKPNATRGNDTVLNYVYKKDYINLSHKLKSHPKNSIHRKKRSTDNYGDHIRYAASAPLIVSYETNHRPRHREPLDLPKSGIIQNAHLADFNIETLHESQPTPNSEKVKDHFRKKYNQQDYPPKPTEKDRESNDRDNYREDRKISYNDEERDVRRSDESGETNNYRERQPQYNQDNRNKNRQEDSNENREKSDYREKDKTLYQNQGRSAENDDRRRSDSNGNNESTERNRYTDQEDRRNDEKKTEKDQKKSGPYRGSGERVDYRDSEIILRNRDDYNSGERGDYRETPTPIQRVDDSREYTARKNSDSKENDEKPNYREKVFPHRSQSNYGSYEKDYPPNNKPTYRSIEKDFPPENKHGNKYSLPSKDSNESRESDAPYSIRAPESQESEEKNYNNGPKSANTKHRNDYVDSRENEEYRNNGQPLYQDVPQTNRENIYINNDSNPKTLLLQNDDESDEEAIIIMTKKNRKNSYSDKYSTPTIVSNKTSPSEIQDVDLGDFSYERIKVNDQGVVEPVKETYSDYDVDSKAQITPLTTFKPELKESGTPLTSKIIDSSRRSTKNPITLNDGEVKPVVELHGDKDNSNEENGKQGLNTESDENQSLESLLGVQESIEQGGKIVEESVENDNVDAKQQFERIPTNYNHNNQQNLKEHDKENINTEPIILERKTITELPPSALVLETDDSPSDLPNDGILETTTPEKYDNQLNIKFDETPITLPEIKLPEDVLSYVYEEPEYVRNQNKQNKFYVYDNTKKKKDDYDDSYDENDSREINHQYRKPDKEEDDNYQPSFYGPPKEKDEYKEEKKQDPDYDDEGVDLYEKFVRERFGKRGSFAKRSANIAERPMLENPKLYGTLHQVLKKTENIEKDAAKSGDPKAGYMWTLEYGQNL